MTTPHVLVLYNQPTLPPEHPESAAEHDVVALAGHVADRLRQAKFQISLLGIAGDPAPLIHFVHDRRPGVVFNLFEGTARFPNTEAYVAGVLEWLGVPYTGCPFPCIVSAHDKFRAKLMLRGAGLPTPAGFLIEKPDDIPECRLGWPIIVKPASEDASVGIDQSSVVRDQRELEDRATLLLSRYGPVLIEEFIDGREFNVAVIENPELRVLPISEIVFDRKSSRWPIVTYEAKWSPGSSEDLATVPHCPADIPPPLAVRLNDLAEAAWRLFGCRDYARIDFRVNSAGEPFLLEINPNPDFSPTAGLARALNVAGVDHRQFTADLVRQALSRGY